MRTRKAVMRTAVISALLMAAGGVPGAAGAGEEDTTARLREMLHRTQEALHQAQSDNAELTRAKTEAQQKLNAATKDLEAARGVSKAELALRGQLQTTKAAQDELVRKLGETNTALAAANTKLNETAKQLTGREAELAQVKQGLERSKTVNAMCEDKNLKLYGYAQEVLQAYKKKGVWAALSQKDPVLGLKEVDVENVVQEYRLKMASQKIQTPAP
jgi:chromosome segregation ATPase